MSEEVPDRYTRIRNLREIFRDLILKAQQNWEAAIDTLYRAAWDYEYASASYYQLAQISATLGNDVRAMEEVNMAVNYNGMNVDAKNLKTTLLRKAGKKAEAVALAKEVVKFDPLNYYATNELVLMGAKPASELTKLMRGVPESYLELAMYYYNNGFTKEMKDVLMASESAKPYPTVEYWLGYLADQAGDTDAARSWFKKAEDRSIAYVFPFRLETIKARMNRILAENTGNSVEEVTAACERDNFMSSEEAKAFGLIDRVLERH